MMLLTGDHMTFGMKANVLAGGGVLLRPFCFDPTYEAGDPIENSMGAPELWTDREVADAAAWWQSLAQDQEPEDYEHVPFGGGLLLARVHTHGSADFGIDVIVLNDPDDEVPDIEYDFDGRGHVSVDIGQEDHYITVDTTTARVQEAAEWWQDLHRQVLERQN